MAPTAPGFWLGREGSDLMPTTFSKARSKSFGSSDVSNSRATARKRLWRSASVSLGSRFRAGLRGMGERILYGGQIKPHFRERERLHFAFREIGSFCDLKKEHGVDSIICHGSPSLTAKIPSAPSNGNSSFRGSGATFGRRHERGRLGRLRWPWATSFFIGQPLALHAFQARSARATSWTPSRTRLLYRKSNSHKYRCRWASETCWYTS
jgi:hypothetical protein